MTVNFTIGADPEIFLVNRSTGAAVSAHDLLPGTKAIPYKVECGAVQVDGTAAEFNIDPTNISDFPAFNENIVAVMKQLSGMVGKKYSFNLNPVQDYPKDYFDTLPMAAIELGCEPDFNAYTGRVNPRPDNTKTFRTAAGHIHIGWGSGIPKDDEEHMAICCEFVKMLDITAGLFSLRLGGDPRRRELYGKAGAFRPKEYGVEYRTPSNRWLATKATRYTMWFCTNLAVTLMKRYGDPDKLLQAIGVMVSDRTRYMTTSDIEEVINNNDTARADQILVLLFSTFGGGANFTNYSKSLRDMAALDSKKEEANGKK